MNVRGIQALNWPFRALFSSRNRARSTVFEACTSSSSRSAKPSGGEVRLGRSPERGGGWLAWPAAEEARGRMGQGTHRHRAKSRHQRLGEAPPTPLGLAAESDLPTPRYARGGRRISTGLRSVYNHRHVRRFPRLGAGDAPRHGRPAGARADLPLGHPRHDGGGAPARGGAGGADRVLHPRLLRPRRRGAAAASRRRPAGVPDRRRAAPVLDRLRDGVRAPQRPQAAHRRGRDHAGPHPQRRRLPARDPADGRPRRHHGDDPAWPAGPRRARSRSPSSSRSSPR